MDGARREEWVTGSIKSQHLTKAGDIVQTMLGSKNAMKKLIRILEILQVKQEMKVVLKGPRIYQLFYEQTFRSNC